MGMVPKGRELRERLLDRAGHQCEFVSDQGTRCGERTGLHIDHIWPFGRGGPTTKSNLRCLCSAHNRYEAERVYGASFIRAKIAARRAEAASP